MSAVKKLTKNRQAKMIDGVCAGVADYFQIDVTIVRVIWVVAVFIKGIGVFAYLLCMLLLPPGDDKRPSTAAAGHPNAGMIGGIVLIIFGFFILAGDGHWWRPFWFHYGRCPFHFGYEFWAAVLVVAGIAYLIYALNSNRSSKNGESEAAPSGKRGGSGKTGDVKTLTRDSAGKWIGGVCSGVAAYAGIDPVVVRIGAILLALVSDLLPVVLLYVVLMFVLPENDHT
ncbi:PspC domain-containing protein [bacterium]|nr:PspC domain-containing protein [bacterium]